MRKLISKLVDMMDWALWRVHHRHNWKCTNRPDNTLPSSERPYHHLHECSGCQQTRSGMNWDCEAGYGRY